MRPISRGDCLPGGSNSLRPCPYATCKYHMGVSEGWEDRETCSLDLADLGGVSYSRIANELNENEETIIKVAQRALTKIRTALKVSL